MKFENVLAEVGGFGRFQLLMILLMAIPRVTLPFHFLLNNFIAFIPSHHCDISSLDDGEVFSYLPQAERLAVSIPVQVDGTPNSCQMFAEPQYHLLLNSSNMTELPTVPCQNGLVYYNTTFKSTLATEWDLVCDKRRVNKATITIFFIGVMIGAAVFGYLSDRIGRKTTLLVSYMTTAFFGFASAFSYNFAMFAAMRFLTGFGISGIHIISIVLCIEWVDIKHRTAVSLLMSLDTSLGAALLPLAAYFVTDWRYLTATGTAPLFLAMICWWWIPESARWLINNGKVNSAHFYLSKCAKVNGREQFMADITPEILSKAILVENENRKYSYLDLVRTPRMRRLALLTGTLWFGVACTFYGICMNISGFGVNIYLTQFIYAVIELPGKAIIFFTLNKIGRRWSQAGMLFLTGLCLFSNMFVPQDNENRKYSYLDLVRTPRMRRLALLTGVMWFGLACIYYGITFNITGFGVNIYLTQFIYAVIEFPGKAFVFFTLSKIGQRWNDTGMLFLTGLCIFCNMFVPQDKGPFRTALGALGKMFAEASFATVFLHTTELYPTVMRQNGLGYCSFIGRLGVSISPLIMLLEEVWGHLPSTIFSLMAVAAGLSASFLPETHNIRLLETIEDVEHTRKRSISASDEKFQS